MAEIPVVSEDVQVVLATIKVRLENIDRGILDLRNRMDRISEDCPPHRTQTALNTESIAHLEKNVDSIKRDTDRQIGLLWARVWIIAGGGVGGGGLIALVMWLAR